MSLTDLACRTAVCPAEQKSLRKADGKALYLEVTAAGGKYWRWKYRFAGKEKRLASAYRCEPRPSYAKRPTTTWRCWSKTPSAS